MGAYFIHYYHYFYFFWCFRCLRFCQWEPLQAGFCVLWHVPSTLWVLSYILVHQLVSGSSCTFPVPVLESAISLRTPVFLLVSFSSQDLVSLSGWAGKYVNEHVHTHTYTHIHLNVCLFMEIHEFTPILPIPIQSYRNHSSFFTFHICNFFLH